jgi:hypothetical protein
VAATGLVRVPFLTAEEARRAAQALEPDNEGLLVSRIEGKDLVLEARGTAMGVLRTLDDALGCLRALQGATGAAQST